MKKIKDHIIIKIYLTIFNCVVNLKMTIGINKYYRPMAYLLNIIKTFYLQKIINTLYSILNYNHFKIYLVLVIYK